MGHKINPTSLRLKITDTWKSRWFVKKGFQKALEEDVNIRAYLEQALKKAGLVRLIIERTGNGQITLTVRTTKPGLIIGKGGAGIEDLKKKIKQKLGIKKDLRVNIEEVRDINLQAQVVADFISEQIEKRVAFRKLMKQSLEQMMQAGAKGAKVSIGGRLNGADIARTEHLSQGKIPLHTLRADIDFARSTAFTTYGTVGIKVWIYRGDIFEEKQVQNSKVKMQN
ncbi:MAG: 30S ribosomal protein S3 [Candidatus Doudnabacteria bacterium]|nr:30S ribosomal protein S3 [Candidatus Doudnabacteria bacterium]